MKKLTTFDKFALVFCYGMIAFSLIGAIFGNASL